GEFLRNTFDGLDLVHSLDDIRADGYRIERLPSAALKDSPILQRILGIESVDLPWRIPLHVIPHEDLMPVRVEDHRPMAVLFFQSIGVEFSLFTALFGISDRSLRFDDTDWAPIVAPENVIGIAPAGGGGLARDFVLLGDFG